MNSRRYACAVVPDFPLAIWIYQEPKLMNRPMAIAETEKDTSPLIICSAKALETGVSAAMTAAQAHSRCPDLIIKRRNYKKETELSGLIVKKLQTLSPFVEEDGTRGDEALSVDGTPGLFFLDASGLRFIYRDEAEFGAKIGMTVNALGFPVRVGIAGNKFTAHIAAISSPLLQPTGCQAGMPDGPAKSKGSHCEEPSRHHERSRRTRSDDAIAVDSLHRAKSKSGASPRVTIVPSGSERTFLTTLPVDHLPLAEETCERLRNLGLKQIGQLIAFPANEIMERFGAEGALLSQLSAGIDRSFFRPDIPVEPISQTVPFIFSITDSRLLIAHTEQLLTQLLERLRRSGQASTTFLLTCRLADRSAIPLTVTLDRPSTAPALFIRQLRLTLEKIVLPSPVTEITVSIPQPIPLIMEQTELRQQTAGGSSARSYPPALNIQSPLYTPELHETHLPETAFRLTPLQFLPRGRKPQRSEPSPLRQQTFTGHPVTGLRLLQPPLAGKLVTAQGRTLLWTSPKQSWLIACQRGPWKLSGGWWSGAFDRFYYEMQTVDRQCYLVYFDRLMSQWFVQGVFD